MKNNCSTVKSDDGLSCSVCGNRERFVEVMAVETHLVNGRKDYIKLLDGIADHYLCWICGSTVENAATGKP